MTVCRHGFHDRAIAYILHLIWLKFVVKAIFSCLNLKTDDGFLPYNMLKVFNKTGHCLTGIVIAWDEFKLVLHT